MSLSVGKSIILASSVWETDVWIQLSSLGIDCLVTYVKIPNVQYTFGKQVCIKMLVNFEMSFWCFQFFQKRTKKFDLTTMIPQVELFLFVF